MRKVDADIPDAIVGFALAGHTAKNIIIATDKSRAALQGLLQQIHAVVDAGGGVDHEAHS